MNQKLIILAVCILTVTSFTIIQKKDKSPATLQSIPWPFTNCGTGDWNIQKLTLSQTPARNQNMDMSVLGTATDDTSFTSVYFVVKLNGAFIHDDTVDFKKSYAEGDTIEFKYVNYIPLIAPIGSYSISFQFKNGDKNNGCISFNFKL